MIVSHEKMQKRRPTELFTPALLPSTSTSKGPRTQETRAGKRTQSDLPTVTHHPNSPETPLPLYSLTLSLLHIPKCSIPSSHPPPLFRHPLELLPEPKPRPQPLDTNLGMHHRQPAPLLLLLAALQPRRLQGRRRRRPQYLRRVGGGPFERRVD